MQEVLSDPLTAKRDHRQDSDPSSPPTVPPHWLAAAILLSSIFLYLQVFVLPATPRLALGDQAIYLHHATRMLDGELIYRDYDHFTFPGTDVIYMVLFWLFGVRAWIPQAMLIVLGASTTWLIVLISEKVISGTAALLPGLLFVTLPFSSYLDATHHWYSTLATTAALAALLEKRSLARLIWAGILLGTATFFTQSVGLLAIGIALFLLWERRQDGQLWNLLLKKEASLLISFLATISACLAYFLQKVGLKQLLYYTVVFVVKYYPADWFNTWHVYLTGHPQRHDWTTWFDVPAFALIHLTIPLVYVLFFVTFAAQSSALSGELRKRLMLINLAGLFLFLSVASAPAYSRLYAVSAPALVLLVWFLHSHNLGRGCRRFLWATILVMAIARPLFIQLRWHASLDLPTGRTAFFDPGTHEKFKWLSEQTRPGDYFFGDQLAEFSLGLRNASRIPFLRPTDYTRPEEVRDVIEGLEKFQVRFVSWYHGLDYETDAARHPAGNHLAPIRLYLHEHYHLAQTFSDGDQQIWERNQ
jgi:hypothetical protein